MVRFTIRLPDELHERLWARSRETRVSLNHHIVAALAAALPAVESEDGARAGAAACPGSAGEVERPSREQEMALLRHALRDLLVDIDDSWFLTPRQRLSPAERAAFLESLPVLNPQVSTTIIGDCKDRI